MKKAVFTIQMFVLMAAFPAYLVMELNQRTGSRPVNVLPSKSIEKPEDINIQSFLNHKGEELPSTVRRMNAYYFKSVKPSVLVSKIHVK
jgi:hypothetical protein